MLFCWSQLCLTVVWNQCSHSTHTRRFSVPRLWISCVQRRCTDRLEVHAAVHSSCTCRPNHVHFNYNCLNRLITCLITSIYGTKCCFRSLWFFCLLWRWWRKLYHLCKISRLLRMMLTAKGNAEDKEADTRIQALLHDPVDLDYRQTQYQTHPLPSQANSSQT